MCEALRALHESAGYLELGFSSVAGYAATHLYLRRSECFEHLRVSRALLELPELRAAFARGRTGWTVLKAVTRVAKPATQKAWLECLAKRGPEHTIAESKLAQRDGRDAPRDSDFGLPNLDQRLLLRFSRADMDKIRRWLELEAGGIRQRTGADDVSPEQILLYLSERALSFGKARKEQRGDKKNGSEPSTLGRDKRGRTEHGTDHPSQAEVDPSSTLQTRVVYHRCPDCTRSAIATREGLVEVAPSIVDLHAGCADSIVLDGPTPPSLRRKILGRESGQCGNPQCSRKAEHCHHIVFRSQGGKTSRHNEVAVCATCHALIHAGLLSVEGSPDGPAGAGLKWSPVLASPITFDGASAEGPCSEKPGGEPEGAAKAGASAAGSDATVSGAAGSDPVGSGRTRPGCVESEAEELPIWVRTIERQSANADSGGESGKCPAAGASGTRFDEAGLAQGLVRLGIPVKQSRRVIRAAIDKLGGGDACTEQDILRQALASL